MTTLAFLSHAALAHAAPLSPWVAQISGDALVHWLVYLVVLGIVFWLLWWLVAYVGLPEPFNKVARVVLAVAAVLVLINVLLAMAGHPLMRW